MKLIFTGGAIAIVGGLWMQRNKYLHEIWKKEREGFGKLTKSSAHQHCFWCKKTQVVMHKLNMTDLNSVLTKTDKDPNMAINAMKKAFNDDDDKKKVLNDPIHGTIKLHPLCVRIIDTPQFQRLRFIKQLGMGYFVYPGASHNRFEHSIGVSHLAGQFARALQKKQPDLKITEKDVLCVEIAGLCHDLGHGPFSHLFDGRFIPSIIPGSTWKHEVASSDMFNHMLTTNSLNEFFTEYNLDEDDIKFITELVTGPREQGNSDSKSWPYEGRDEHKRFLYEIVANKRTGIDVDKWDYFARDCHMLGINNNFDHNRCMQFARVIEVDGEKQICFRDKEVYNLYEMFHTRNTLHMRAYKHQVTTIIEHMVAEAMKLADDHITFPGKDGKPVKMSQSIDDMIAFSQLTDNVFLQILYSTGSNKDLVKAREILGKIFNRKVYKFVGKTQLKPGLKMENENESKDEIFNKIVNEKGASSSLEKEDIIFQIAKFDYGMKMKNPIDNVRFYSKHKPNEAFSIKKDEVSQMLPAVFSEQQIRIYCKKGDKPSLEKVKKAFNEWCEEKGYPILR